MNFSGRLQLVMKHYGLTANELADKLRIQKSAVSHLLSGRNKPRFDILQRFAEAFPDLNIRWLLTGKGNLLASPTPPLSVSHHPENISTENNDPIRPSPEMEDADAVEKPRENALNEQNMSPITKNSAHEHLNQTKKIDTPSEILRIYEDGTFDILKRRQ